MRRAFVFAIVIVLALLCYQSTSRADNPANAKLTITVQDQTGNSVTDAKVYVVTADQMKQWKTDHKANKGKKGGKKEHAMPPGVPAQLGNDGTYSVQLPPGDYFIIASAKSVGHAHEKMTLAAAGSTTTVTLGQHMGKGKHKNANAPTTAPVK